MNKTVTNLTLIADAAEYFRNNTAAFRIRSTLTSMGVWAANAFLNVTNDPKAEAQRVFEAMTKLATIRTWLRDSNTSSFVLDLTTTAVENQLGLNKVVDEHEEAKRIARQKMKQTLSTSKEKYMQYYKAAKQALEEQTKKRRERVEEITNLLSDTSFTVTDDVRDYAASFLNFDMQQSMQDCDLYDDNYVERESDRLDQTVGVACESLLLDINAAYDATVVEKTINKLAGYKKAVLSMMDVIGVDTKRLAERAEHRNKAWSDIESELDAKEAISNAQLDALESELQDELSEPKAEDKPKRKRVAVAA